MSDAEHIRAGEAFLQCVKPAELEELQARLCAILRVVKEHKPEIRRQLDEWEAVHGEPWPRMIEDIQRLLVRAGASPDAVLKDEIPLAVAGPIIEGYFERLRDQRRGTAGPTEEASPMPTPADSFAAGRRGGVVADRMMSILRNNNEAVGWSLARWGNELDCPRSTVQSTTVWKGFIIPERERMRRERNGL